MSILGDLKKRNAKINKLYTVFEKFYQGQGRTEAEKASAKEKIIREINLVTNCTRFGNCDEQLLQCRNCEGNTATVAKIKVMCKALKPEKAPSKKETLEKNEFGIRTNSKLHELVEKLKIYPLKMSDIQRELRVNYFSALKKKPTVFGCTTNGYWFVYGEISETIAEKYQEMHEREKQILQELKKKLGGNDARDTEQDKKVREET